LVVNDKAEAGIICDYIRGRGERDAVLAKFKDAVSPGFNPDTDLARIGLANQTTMLMSESLEIGEMFRAAMIERYGEAEMSTRYRAFDTICSATQDRQDAVIRLLQDETLDLMIVIGGYNSSNTCNLAHICAEQVSTFHVADPDCLVSPDVIRHRPVGRKVEHETTGWLRPSGAIRIGLTSGASTPDNLVEQVVRRLDAFANTPDL
jgi:4-hydroxy-3-methylbut-2-en-1-yl diphosphate reductase